VTNAIAWGQRTLQRLIPTSVRTRFNTLNAREQTVTLWGIAALLLIALYSLVWLPAQRSIPALSAMRVDQASTLATLQSANNEIKSLRASVDAAKLKPNADAAMLRNALAQSGVDASTVELQLEGSNAVRFAAQRVPAAAWLNWLATVQREYALVVREAQVTPLDNGVVRVSARLARQ
jgi:general secretion pathway protein M